MEEVHTSEEYGFSPVSVCKCFICIFNCENPSVQLFKENKDRVSRQGEFTCVPPSENSVEGRIHKLCKDTVSFQSVFPCVFLTLVN